MSLSVSFRHSARTEFIEAAAWYESERQNLGVEFIAEIERCVAAAAERPMTYTAVYAPLRVIFWRIICFMRQLALYCWRKNQLAPSKPYGQTTPR